MASLEEGFEDHGPVSLDEAFNLRDDGCDGLFEIFFTQTIQDSDGYVGRYFVPGYGSDAVFEDGAVDLLE